MAERICSRAHNCIWTEKDSFCQVLKLASVPVDSKWPLAILYLRGVKDIIYLSEIQKSQLQELLMAVLQSRDYSQAHYDEVQLAIFSIITAPFQSKLTEILRETSELAKDVRGLFGKHQQEVSLVAQNMDRELANGVDPAFLLAEIRDELKDVIAKMEQDANALTTLSYRDSLTGLANRRFFDIFLDECVQSWKEAREPISLIMFDIDFFKKFNDTYGHLVGDQVLSTLADQVQKIIAGLSTEGSRILAARYGGEEFCVILCGKVVERSEQIGELLRKSIQDTTLLLKDAEGKVLESGLRVTVSVGIASMQASWTGAFQRNLMDCADKALYHAKNSGRNCTVRYSPDERHSYTRFLSG